MSEPAGRAKPMDGKSDDSTAGAQPNTESRRIDSSANEVIASGRVTDAQRAAIMQLCHPVKGVIEGMTITLVGDGDALGAEERMITDRMCMPNPTNIFEHLDFLVRSTSSWTGFNRNEKEFPCTPENVRQLYRDHQRFYWLREQVELFVTTNGARYMSALRWYAYIREHATTFPNREPRGLANIVGQSETVRRLTKLADTALRNGSPAQHILLLGPEGSGKEKIAREVAWQLGAKLRQTDSASIEQPIDMTAIVNDPDDGYVLLLSNVNRLRKEVLQVLIPAMRRFELVQAIGGCDITISVKPFTLIATAQREADCRRDLLDSFDLIIRLQKYSEPEMVQLLERLAGLTGLTLEPAASSFIRRLADGNPGRATLLVERLIRLSNSQIVSEQAARDLLSIPAHSSPADVNLEKIPTDWNELSGIDFERLITSLLKKMGFAAEMTKASGDGGIDIEAVLDGPIVGGRYLVQCKRFSAETLVGSPTIREFYGAVVADRKAVKGILITTSAFTAQARDFAAGLPIELIDGKSLAGLFSRYAEVDGKSFDRH
jgi:Holliday junction resolvasome RuvABC ATP-dependent DNA helicase subunit